MIKVTIKTDFSLVLPLFLFFILLLPFLGSIPYRDGNIDFIQAYHFYEGGFGRYFTEWDTVHPPLKIVLARVFFTLFGLNSFAYTLMGLIAGFGGILSIFLLNKRLFGVGVARLSSLLLATSPLFLATGIFALTDYLVTIFLLLSLYLYLAKKYLSFILITTAAVLTKETALVLPLVIVLVEIGYFLFSLRKRFQLSRLTDILLPALPLGAFLIWLSFLKLNNKEVWGDYIFTDSAKNGTFYTVLYNLITLRFLNEYAYQHWLQLLLLNFNLIFWLLCVGGAVVFILSPHIRQRFFLNLQLEEEKTKAMLIIVFFMITYLLTVLSIQTYTIPRYALPVIPFMITGASLVLINILKRNFFLGLLSITFLFLLVLLSLFTSKDPLPSKLWGHTEFLGENLYALNRTWAGNDGLTYNMQYLFMVKRRSDALYQGSKNPYTNTGFQKLDCREIFADPNNDNRMVKILKLNENNITQSFPCRFENR